MASAIYDCSWASPPSNYFHGCFQLSEVKESRANISDLVQVPALSLQKDIPLPPPPPGSGLSKSSHDKSSQCCCVPKETRDLWDTLFKQGYGADVCIVTEEQATISAHFSVLVIASLYLYLSICCHSIASPVLGNCLQNSEPKNGVRYLKILGVPHGAICTFVRFLYSSWYVSHPFFTIMSSLDARLITSSYSPPPLFCSYEEEYMKKFVLHLLVLSHSYVVPFLKRVCMQYLESCWLTTENLIDVLQLARNCDAPRLSFICIRMVVKHFTTVASTQGWKVMKRVNPALEQELLEAVVEADSRKQERLHKLEERKVYLQLHEAMEALNHICKDGCSTIGPREKMLKGSQVACGFPACKGIEMLVRHFFNCKTRVPGGCVQCRRMWQLLELHSRMCNDPDSCNVPLCR
ncbi:hypothetical protein Cgig2_010441 [Carnegiea gigantea]|uniref:TAZ-type domain-containing protein n=1 Tax=Carnegiea gigantea TaxID=171969 RepID=A0A9Q1GYN9_9CARY|nr:hypothetical protein Cgig2_010441 [Carnegiea gigantea]